MNNLRYKLARFMYGRNGTDQLNRAILAVTFAAMVLSLFARTRIFYYIALLGLIITYYRMLSRNIYKRQAENQKYLNLTAGIRNTIAKKKRQSQDKEHRYFECPSCKQTVRVPRGRGKIEITCPKCRTSFIKKS